MSSPNKKKSIQMKVPQAKNYVERLTPSQMGVRGPCLKVSTVDLTNLAGK